VRWNVNERYWARLTFSLILFFTSFNHAMNLLQNIVGAINKTDALLHITLFFDNSRCWQEKHGKWLLVL
jgi:hypothetical protein